MRAYVIAIGLLLVIFGSIAGYLYWQIAALAATDFTPPPVTIAAAAATAETWNAELDAVGTIRSARGVGLSVEASGEVVSIQVESGDRVSAGQLILSLDDEVERASRERQTASLELAKILFSRDSELARQNSISRSQFDRSKADFERASAELAEPRARLDNKHIYAPFAGTIGIIQVEQGDYVEPGDAIANLQDLSELEVDFTVPARHFPSLRPGLAIEVRVAAFPERSFAATLSAVDAKVDAGTRNLLLRAKVDEGEGLLPGMFAQLTIDLARPQETLTVPETAVTFSLHGDTVFLIEEVDGDLVAQPRVVRTGESRDGRVAILDGLELGDRVASVGQNKLYRGVRVAIDDSVELR